jgi:hypothetical protein
MNDRDIDDICTERLGRWKKLLIQEHSTPVLLVAVGHDHKKGQLTLVTTEDITDQQLLTFMRYAIIELEGRAGRHGKAS